MTTSHQSKPFELIREPDSGDDAAGYLGEHKVSTGHRSRGRRAVSVTIDGGYLL